MHLARSLRLETMQPTSPRKKQLVSKVITVPGNLHLGCDEFNAGLFYESHERFEEIWQYERGPVRDFYKGLIHGAAGYVHLSRANYRGAERLLRTAIGYLEPYRATGALGFDVDAISSALEGAYARLAALGPNRASEFDLTTRPRYAFDSTVLAEEAVRWSAWGFDESGHPLSMTIVIAE